MNSFDKSETDTKNSSPQVGHDTATPPNLIAFMLKDWKKPAQRALPAVKQVKHLRARREVLSHAFPGEVLVIPAGHNKVRSNDTHYPFRPNSDFYYLSGSLEPDSVLVMMPRAKGHDTYLFVEGNPGKTSPTFFTDRNKGELWVGPRQGVDESLQVFGVDKCVTLAELPKFLNASVLGAGLSTRMQIGFSSSTEALLKRDSSQASKQDSELTTFLSEMRLLKDEFELGELAKAVASTKRGFEDAIVRMKTAKSEREIEGVFFLRARTEGNDVGYGTIAAAGAHACTLHWTRNDGVLKQGDLMLLDAGVEGNTLYTADVTRTLPIGGKFTKEQREIYDLVLAAQAAAFKKVKPGNDFMAPNRAAMEVLSAGLEKLGILPTTAKEALREENQFYKRYSLHNVSHMLGLDVHDCAQARKETYKFGALKPGMVLTVEPGLYFQLDDMTVPAKYRGIGVRIEDDLVVTKTGYKNLSSAIPSEARDVEKWIASLWSPSKSKRVAKTSGKGSKSKRRK